MYPDQRVAFMIGAVATAALAGALLEGEEVAPRVDLRRLRVVEQLAEVEEVLLRGGALGQLHPAPLGDEFGEVHGVGAAGGSYPAER
jgi:hypothetical protein